MNIQVFEDVENERIVNFLKNKKNCVACLNEPPGGSIMRLMMKKSIKIKSLNWCWFPNANTFELLTVNSDQNVKSINKIYYEKLDDLIEEMCLFAMITNLIKDSKTLMSIPKGTFILVFNDKSPKLDIIEKWRQMQEQKLLFTCKQSEWTNNIFPKTGVYKWPGM